MHRTFKQFLTESTVTGSFVEIDKSSKLRGRERLEKACGFTAQQVSKLRAYMTTATPSNMMSAYNKFVDAFPKEARDISLAAPKGIGPGELTMYYVFDNVGIGGANSPIDIFLDGKPFAEAKAADLSGDTLTNFKITRDGSKAVIRLLKDLEEFNDKYNEITGEDLPGWREASELKTTALRSWKDIDLKKLAAETKGGSKKSIPLTLKTDGDLMRKGDDEPVLNVKTSKSTAPIKKLIDGSGTVAVDPSIATLDTIISRWVDGAFEDYVEGKRFALLVGTKSGRAPRMRFLGKLTKDMVGLYATHRNQPWAEVYLAPSKSKGSAKGGKPKAGEAEE